MLMLYARRVESYEALKSVSPATASERTASVCPCRDFMRLNVTRSHTHMLQS